MILPSLLTNTCLLTFHFGKSICGCYSWKVYDIIMVGKTAGHTCCMINGKSKRGGLLIILIKQQKHTLTKPNQKTQKEIGLHLDLLIFYNARAFDTLVLYKLPCLEALGTQMFDDDR